MFFGIFVLVFRGGEEAIVVFLFRYIFFGFIYRILEVSVSCSGLFHSVFLWCVCLGGWLC